MERLDALHFELMGLHCQRRKLAQSRRSPQTVKELERILQRIYALEKDYQAIRDSEGVTRAELQFSLPRLQWQLAKASDDFHEGGSQAEFEWAWSQLNSAYRRLEFLGSP